MNRKTYEQKIVPIVIFLTMEIILLLAFNFGNFPTVFKIFAFAFLIILFPYFKKEFDIDLSHGLFLLFAPLMLFGFATILSPAYGFNTSYQTYFIFMQRNLFKLTVNVIGVLSLLVLGYFVRKSKLISPPYVIGIILSGLSLLLFVSLAATLVNYGFFHRIIYAGRVHFYGGVPYDISNQVSFLQGFEIVTVYAKVLTNLALFILSSVVGLLFIKEINNKKIVWALIFFASLSFLSLILIGDLLTIIFIIPGLLIALGIKFKLSKWKHFNKLMIGIGSLFVLGIILFFVNAFNLFNIQQLWAGNVITRKLMMNGIIMKFYAVTKDTLTSGSMFGIPLKVNYSFSHTIFPTGNIIFDSLRIDGVFGVLALVSFLGIATYSTVKYFQLSQDNIAIKIVIISLLITMGSRFMFSYPFHQYIYTEELWMVDYFPLIESPYFLITVFLTGYMQVRKPIKGVEHVK